MKALNIREIESMCYVSYRVFIVGVAFWLPLERKVYCKREDVATRLSLGFMFENLVEMRGQFEKRQKYRPHKERGICSIISWPNCWR